MKTQSRSDDHADRPPDLNWASLDHRNDPTRSETAQLRAFSVKIRLAQLCLSFAVRFGADRDAGRLADD